MTTATCRVTFGESSESDAYAVLELDETLNLDADGEPKATFAEGDTIWFLMHVQPGWVPSLAYQTDGQVSYVGQVTRLRTQKGVVWSPENLSIDLTYYPVGEVAVDWQGNEIDLLPPLGRTLKALLDPLNVMARADLTYTVSFDLYRFDPPAGLVLAEDQDYQIDAMITLEADL
jgi:hypothetical protein